MTTDASDIAMGAVLSQTDENGLDRIISCFSKKFVKAQQNYSTTDKEALALEKGILHFDHYLRGKTFILKTDHQALQYIKTASNHNSRILRTALRLQEYSYEPIYIKGDTNIADFLSRPIESCQVNVINSELTEETKREIIKKYHLISGHGTTNNVKFLIRKQQSWKGIHSDIDKVISECKTCNLAGEALVNSKNRVIRSAYPNELW